MRQLVELVVCGVLRPSPIGAGTALVRFCELMKADKVIVSEKSYQQMMKSLESFERCARASNLKLTMKSHNLLHMVKRSRGPNLGRSQLGH
jgi:hypothetical protein